MYRDSMWEKAGADRRDTGALRGQERSLPAVAVRAGTPAGPRAAVPPNWLSFGLQVALVASIELGDDLTHALIGQRNPRLSVDDALRLVDFERLHGLWIEPAIQRFFEQSHEVLGLAVSWVQVVPIFDIIYGPGHVVATLAFALWVYLCRRGLFRLLRNIFVLTNALAVVMYEIFPTAPPRLTPGLHYQGHAYHFTDAVFGPTSVLKIGFNEFAAMPSLHVAWALIAGATIAWAASPPLARLLALFWPAIMLVTVVVTGNHYLADGLGALAVLCIAAPLALLIEWWRGGDASFGRLLRRLRQLRHPEPLTAIYGGAPRHAAW